jgi:hypothetical protein
MRMEPAVGAVEMWKSDALVFCRISKPGGKGGKLAFGVFQAFHGASFPRRIFISLSSERSDAGYCSLPRFLRIDSPRISIRWALWTSRSRMLSASVGSPIRSCHLATGSWLVRTVERS